MDKIRILHIIKDDKFFDPIYELFETYDAFKNDYVLFVSSKQYSFKRIKNTRVVNVVFGNKNIKKILLSNTYDIVYLHSISISTIKYLSYIPKDKTIIWWAWGYDIYGTEGGMPSLINIPLYRTYTKQLINSNAILSFAKKIVKRVLAIVPTFQRKNIIRRVSYFQPVLSIEYTMLCNIKYFRAKEFYIISKLPQIKDYYITSHFTEPLNKACVKPCNGNIIIGNSASPFNNHLDLWNSIEKYVPSDREVLIPVSYGGDMSYVANIKSRISSEKCHIRFIENYMSRDDYWKLLDSCSYAIYGSVRQHAMGNIYHDLLNGIKVFLYSDSVIFRYLKSVGYVVYAIEDVDVNSFFTPMSVEEIGQNLKARKNEFEYCKSIEEAAIKNIQKDISFINNKRSF